MTRRSSAKRYAIGVVLTLALAFAGVASAYGLSKTIFIKPGHCKKVHATKVCARKAAAKTVTSTVTVVTTTPVIGTTFSGNGNKTLAPVTLPQGENVQWTAQAGGSGIIFFSVHSQPSDTNYVTFDNGNGSTSGTSYVPAGTYTFSITSFGPWTLSF
jgi:hypothetical protein